MRKNKYYMSICLNLAIKGLGKVSPNPMVGAVVVKNNKIVGSGYHQHFGGLHAEVYALRQAGNKALGAILYVNLEPCSHWGKTPPCTEAIVRAGIKNVVIAMKDPNPIVSGKGIKFLKNHGIAVETRVLEHEAKELNKTYLKFITKKMPYVILKSAMSMDGKIATKNGQSKWITGELARKYVHKLRSQVDAILVGKNTVLQDNPSLTAHKTGRNPVRVIIVPDSAIKPDFKVFNNQAKTIIITKNNVKVNYNILSKNNVESIAIKDVNGKIPFKQILKRLADKGIASVLVEGGGETNALALESGVVDEIMFFIAPKIIGGRDSKTPIEGQGINKLSRHWQVKDMTVESIGQDWLVRGKIA